MNAFIAENDQEIHEEEKTMNEKFEKYIKDLSPELQEKARQCKTMEELNAFLAENDLEMPEEALELVAGGGCFRSTEVPDVPVRRRFPDKKCKICNSIVRFYQPGDGRRGGYLCLICKRYMELSELESV